MGKGMMIANFLLLLIVVTGCSSSMNGISEIDGKLQKYVPLKNVPVINNLSIKEVWIKHGMDNQHGDMNTIVITYANINGEFKKEKLNPSEDVTLLYGPYEGDKVFTLSVTELEVDYDDQLETKLWIGIELSFTEIGDYLILLARHNNLS